MEGNIVNKKILISLTVILLIVVVFAFLNRGDKEDRLLSQRESKIFIRLADEETITVSFDDILKLDQHEFKTVLRSSSSDDKEHLYKGIKLKDLLESYNINVNEINQVITKAVDGYAVVLTSQEVKDDNNVYIAYEIDGVPLAPKDKGGSGPYQIIITKDPFAQRWNKFLMELEIR
jgi:hypothetical protein